MPRASKGGLLHVLQYTMYKTYISYKKYYPSFDPTNSIQFFISEYGYFTALETANDRKQLKLLM